MLFDSRYADPDHHSLVSKSSSSSIEARRRRFAVRRLKHTHPKPIGKEDLNYTAVVGRQSGSSESRSADDHSGARKVDYGKLTPGASSSTDFRRLDGDINRPAGIPLTGQDIVGSDNKARGVHCVAHGSICVIGRRRAMEDTLTVAPSDFPESHDFFGVYDGHGGASVSSFCRDVMHRVIGEAIEKWSRSGNEWERVMKECFWRVDEEVRKGDGDEVGGSGGGSERRNSATRRGAGEVWSGSVAGLLKTTGSTALVVVLGKRDIVVANCGHSRAVLFRNGVVVPLSSDHRPDRPAERQRVEAAGGKIIDINGLRVLGVLKTSRSIGDHDLKPYLTCEPEVLVYRRSELDNFFIIASDGLWDVLSSEDACQVVNNCLDGQTRRILPSESTRSPAIAAAMLAELAMARGSKDNISVIVVQLKE